MPLSAIDLLTHFTLEGSSIVTRAGARISLTAAGLFEAEIGVTWQPGIVLRIMTEADSAFSFVDGFGISTLDEIEDIGFDALHMRYLQGEAIFYAGIPDLGVELGFQLVQSRTIIFQQQHHFYDAVEGHLREPTQIAAYISEARDMLRWRFLSASGVFGVNLPLLN